MGQEIYTLHDNGRKLFTSARDCTPIQRFVYVMAKNHHSDDPSSAKPSGLFGGGIQADNAGELMDFMDFRGGADSRNRRPVFKALRSVRESMEDAVESLSEFDLRMSDIHNMLARIVPLLFVFIGAIPAAVTAILGLAAAAVSAGAALLALGGFGALGFGMAGGEFDMERLSNAFSDLRDDFLDTFAPLANELQPLFEDALSGLEDFFDAVANQGDALLALEDEARGFGGFLMAFVPNMLRTMAALVEGMAGVFGDIGGFLRNNLTSVVETLLELTVQIMPVLAQLAQTIGGMLPALVRMSTGFLQILNVLFILIGAFFRLTSALGISARGFGIVVSAALTAATAILLARTAVLSLVYQGFLTMAGAVYSYVVPATATIVSAFTSSAVATYVLTAAIASLITLLTLGAGVALIGMATSAAAKFTSLAGSVGDATSSLKEFRSVQNGLGDDGFGSAGDNPYGFDPESGDGSTSRRGSGGGVTVFNVESSGDAEEDRSNLEHADWLAGRTTT